MVPAVSIVRLCSRGPDRIARAGSCPVNVPRLGVARMGAKMAGRADLAIAPRLEEQRRKLTHLRESQRGVERKRRRVEIVDVERERRMLVEQRIADRKERAGGVPFAPQR